jgi:hypothetical protein
MINSFGFTGSISTMIVEAPPTSKLRPTQQDHASGEAGPAVYYLLLFSAKTKESLKRKIEATYSWGIEHECSLYHLSTLLSVCRDHHPVRKAFIVNDISHLKWDGQPSHLPNLGPQEQDERISETVLALEQIHPTFFSADFPKSLLSSYVVKGQYLALAKELYERGHTLHFSSTFSKDYAPHLLRSFPFYQFDRGYYWLDEPAQLHSSAPITPSAPSITSEFYPLPQTQTEFEDIITTISSTYCKTSVASRTLTPSDHTQHVLITGANGRLGAQLLNQLLSTPSYIVYVIVRGDPLLRLRIAFTKFGLDDTQLQPAVARGVLKGIRIANIGSPRLGISDAVYDELVENLDQIIHAAWPVNFSLPFGDFVPFIHASCMLGQLAIRAKKRVRYHFIGSYASTFNYSDSLVPESPLEPRLTYALAQVRSFLFPLSHRA